MKSKELVVQDKTRIHVSLPVELDRKCRQEAKNRELTVSDVIVKAIEERDYLEEQLLEKEKILEERTEKISKMILESLSEIRKTNLELNIVSSSLTSIPKVTEEARKINETCTKSARVISNFNTVVSEMNETFSSTRQKMNDYHKVLSSNKTNAQEIDEYLIKTKNLFERGFNATASSLQDARDKLVNQFKNDMKLKMDEIIDYEKIKTNTLNDLSNRKVIVFMALWMIVSTFLAFLYIHDSYVRSGIDSDKIKVFDDYKAGLCSRKNRTVDGVNYSKLCD